MQNLKKEEFCTFRRPATSTESCPQLTLFSPFSPLFDGPSTGLWVGGTVWASKF
jgi:hypothetical protein